MGEELGKLATKRALLCNELHLDQFEFLKSVVLVLLMYWEGTGRDGMP